MDKWSDGLTFAVYTFGFLLAAIVVVPPVAFFAYLLYRIMTMPM